MSRLTRWRPLALAVLVLTCSAVQAKTPKTTKDPKAAKASKVSQTARKVAAPAASAAPAAAAALSDETALRNQAASYVVQRAMTLAVLRAECRTLLQAGPLRAEEISRNWWQRNRDALDASHSWLRQWLQSLQASDPPAFQRASVELMASSAQVTLETVRLSFRRQLPDDASCTIAMAPFDEPSADVDRLGTMPGSERYAAYAAALQRVRSEAGWQPLPESQRTFEAQVSTGPLPVLVASLDAARRARENADGPALARIYASMAQRGDAQAALALGQLHWKGDLLPQDPAQAYGWFHRAYVQGDGVGLGAMGQAWLDGKGVPAADLRTGTAAFVLAAAITRDPAERQRAQAQAEALLPRLGADDRAAVACMRLADLDTAIAAPAGPQALRPQLPQPQRRLGELLPALQELATRCG